MTLGPLSHGGELGTKGVSLEIDGQELLRASRVEEGPMKVDLFDFGHPVMIKMLATLGAGRMSDPEDGKLGYDADEYHMESIVEYFNFAILRGAFELLTDDLLPRALKLKFAPDVADTPHEDSHIRMFLFERNWKEHLDLFLEDTIPSAFKSLFSAFKGYTRSSLSSIRHVPPLRDLPPRVFDLNQHPDPLWRRIANQPELRTRINAWLGAKFMKTRYELKVRELAPVDELSQNIPVLLLDEVIELFERGGFGTQMDELMDGIHQQFEALDHVEYVQAHPDLYEILTDIELVDLETWANDLEHNMPDDRDYLLLPSREKRQKARVTVLEVVKDDCHHYPQLWKHFLNGQPHWPEFLGENWDIDKAANRFKSGMMPNTQERRKEIALVEIPSNTVVSLQDVGVGISQVLPVLMNAFGEANSLIAIEQPEIHIHPALQAELGDVFIESALGKNKNTFLLETHSEHLILRILSLVRQNCGWKLAA